jgi:NADH:ubiquinone oxidoreductase subunit K
MNLSSSAAQVDLASQSDHSLATHAVAFIILAVAAAVVAIGVAALASPRWRRIAPRAIGLLVGGLAALYAVGRGIAEFFTVNYSDPASYHESWGGPSLAGVFAVHSGPGFAVLVAAAVWLWRRHVRKRQQPHAMPEDAPELIAARR